MPSFTLSDVGEVSSQDPAAGSVDAAQCATPGGTV